jgi:Ni/Co efflux regulator RcnB
MSRNLLLTGHLIAFALAGTIASGPALADKPTWAGEKGGKSRGHEQAQDRDTPRGQERDRDDGHAKAKERQATRGEHFGDPQRVAAREYYSEHYKSGRCPPGLAKKHNGCMPPGQAKKWKLGNRLPRDVIYYDVPQPLVIQLGQPPRGYRYVRVAGDILMIAIGTSMVVDAIQDLGR